MSPPETNKTTPDNGAESPTTAQPLDMDDDDTQDVSLLADENKGAAPLNKEAPAAQPPVNAPATSNSESEVAPPQPPRPLTEAQKNTLILKEAFPSVDDGVIRAVLTASGGRVEPAFNALLEMTDPDAAQTEPPPPPQPPRPSQQQQMSQLEADERYARQLAEHYDNVGAYEQRTSNRPYGGRTRRQAERELVDEDDRDHSFIDDDLPVIRENLRKGFEETQTKVNGWITQLRKRIEDNFDESGQSSEQGQGQGEYRRRQTGSGRPSGDYDADPQVLGDDFAGMKFSADGTPANRVSTNPGIYPSRSTSSPRPSDGRRVAFQEETEEINMYDSSPQVPPKDAPATSVSKASKWQPLSTMEPSPITDNDPFSLGDSDDEKETKEKPTDAKANETELDEHERLKKDTAEAMAASLVDGKKD